jgi:hypothetical protein
MHARNYVEERVNSLEKDVRHCLQGELAPFPALLYCFAIIDLLGALMSGGAARSRNVRTKEQSILYMTCFMCYTYENATLLIDVFRHKLVHLAQPRPVFQSGSEWIGWRYHHDNREVHLKKLPPLESDKIVVASGWIVTITQEYNVSIMDFANDIKDSAMKKPNGYLARLEESSLLRENYQTAVNQIYDES